MKTWKREVRIHAPIEKVWGLLDGDLETMQKIMPQVVEHKPVRITEEGVGTIYRQKYKEGKRVEEYDVETIEYENTEDFKKLKVFFNLANMFDITAHYELRKIDDAETIFTYTVSNAPKKWFVKLFLMFASDKQLVTFTERVKRIAEEE